jgi:hypothetical protein
MIGLDNPYVLRMDYAFETPNFVAFALECTLKCYDRLPGW